MGSPLVSVVTPFRNTASYLAQCIESVLAQSYKDFEYLLVDNCSTDGSAEIARRYASRDSRISFWSQPQPLSQVANYNSSLTRISDASAYCKVVQADDYIFPDCLRLFVDVFERSERIGLASAYDLKGNVVRGSGFPESESVLTGKDAARLFLRTGICIFGSPTTVMYRSDLVREAKDFYDPSLLHEDTEKCLQILQDWDFGFVHQVLSFLRVGNDSVSSAVRTFAPDELDRHITVQRYASTFLDEPEASELKDRVRREYYRELARQALRFRGAEFWRYHRAGLATLSETLDSRALMRQLGAELIWVASNPGMAIRHAIRYVKRQASRTNGRSV